MVVIITHFLVELAIYCPLLGGYYDYYSDKTCYIVKRKSLVQNQAKKQEHNSCIVAL